MAYLNSDDVYLPGAVTHAVGALQAHPDAAAVYGEGYHVDEAGAILERYPTESFDADRLREICFICQPTVFLRREAVERARQELDRARATFAERGDPLRARIRQWEDSTYRGYDSITRALATRRRQDPRTDTIGADGWASFTLPPGEWWIYGRSWDASDPNAEWYWNLPVTDDTMLLSSRTGRQRRRY